MIDIERYKKKATIVIPAVGIIIGTFYLLQENNILQIANMYHIIFSILITVGLWMGCLLITTFLWKKYPWEFHPIKHISIELISILLYTNLFTYGFYVISKSIHILGFQTKSENLIFEVVVTNLITLFITLLHEAIFFYRQWKFNFSKSIQLEKENLEAKYETLKAQVNPHFLFNSLNSLSYLVDSNKEATKYIQDLSDFLRYAMHNRDSELVLLDEEITFVKKYLALQQTRFGENLQVSIVIEKNSDSNYIPPLTIQMLVENCIKHNIISKEQVLHISILESDNAIIVSNNLQKRINEESIGNGLQNIKHRFAFFTTQEIIISETNETFTVQIPILNFNND